MQNLQRQSGRYETTLLNAISMVIAYFFIGMFLPAILNTTLWRPFCGKFASWMNIATLILISTMFFAGLAKISGYKAKLFDKLTLSGVLFAVGCAIGCFLLLDNFLDPILDRRFPASAVEYQEALRALRQSPVTTFIRVCLFAPITEELLMRGYLLTGLQKKYGTITALLVTTILFALLHFNFVQTLSAVICGWIIGFLYIKTNALSCCILAHALYNAISYFTEILMRI